MTLAGVAPDQYTAVMARTAGRNPIDSLPPALAAAGALLAQATSAQGWLDDSGRLRWANPALLETIGRPLVERGLGFADYTLEPARLEAAFQRACAQTGTVRLPAVPLRPHGVSHALAITALDGSPGCWLDIRTGDEPAPVSVAASLRSLAHELKNPLGGLRGAAQLLSRRVLDADLRAYADVIISEVDRLNALVLRLLAPASPAAPAAVNVHAVLERVRLLLQMEGHEAERDYDPSLPEAIGEPDRLVQVFLNLARNAIEAGARRVVLRSRFERSALFDGGRADALRLEVVDDGVGVIDALRATLFLPLVSGREGGTGLGLATAREIIADHGGRIAFDSRPGHTVFSVWLPIPAGGR